MKNHLFKLGCKTALLERQDFTIDSPQNAHPSPLPMCFCWEEEVVEQTPQQHNSVCMVINYWNINHINHKEIIPYGTQGNYTSRA